MDGSVKAQQVWVAGSSQTSHWRAAALPGSLEKVGEKRALMGQKNWNRNHPELCDLQENAK